MNNGRTIPTEGLGVFSASPESCYSITKLALQKGYRHVDTASIYKNEVAVGRAVRDSEQVKRADVFITTKIQFRDSDGLKLLARKDASATIEELTKFKIDACLEKLDLGYIDLLLLHAPFVGKRLKAWSVMESYVEAGKIMSIGVSNFGVHHISM
jgi:2,5-diketo-D-gluconate reductase A